jgi:hypothetical protein
MPRTNPLLVPIAFTRSLDALGVHLVAEARAIAVVTDSVEVSGADLVAVVELLDVIMKLGASGRAPGLRPERGDPPPARSALVAGKSRKEPALSRAGAGPKPGPTHCALARGSLSLAALATARAAGAASKTGCHRPESLAPERCGNAGLPGD